MFKDIVEFIKSLYANQNPVPLHAPVFIGKEKEYLLDCIDIAYVSYGGKYVTQFEAITAQYTGSKYAIATVSGTTALHITLKLAGVEPGDEVITQPLTFVASANAIKHCGAEPIFIDVDLETLGMSPDKLRDWLNKNTKPSILGQSTKTINKLTDKPISAILPIHSFGHPCRIDKIIEIANKFNIPVIEDSAESLGSFFEGRHTGTFGFAGIISYNGNKTVTTGGGGMIITNNEEFARKAKHITTTAKLPHKWEFIHDEVGYNYRLPNINAAIGVAQMEYMDKKIRNKRETAELYNDYFSDKEINFFVESKNSISNYWLNVIMLKDRNERDSFLEFSNSNGVMTRPVWRLMNKLRMYKNCQASNLDNAEFLEDRIVNIPSGYRI